MEAKSNLTNQDRIQFVRLMMLCLIAMLLVGTGMNCQKLKKDSRQTGITENQILEDIGISRGICVLLGDRNGALAIKLALKSELLLYVQLQQAADVEAARQSVDSAGFYGTRIYVEKGDLTRIHLADNLADAVIAVGETITISEAEVLRVLRPAGKALLGEKELVKPFPDGIDDWSHPYHGPDNNTQSRDQLAIAPYLTQFFAEPHYGPVTQAAVASAGRVFKAFGNVAFHEREEAFLNMLVAFNGYNGIMLWQREIVPGIMLHRNTMIATPKVLYLADDQSCKLIDTETGELKDEIIPPVKIAGGTFWKWMGMEDGVLYALIGEQELKDPVTRWRRQQHGWPWNAISRGFNQPEHTWGFGQNMLAIDPKTKKVIWHYHEEEPIDSRAVGMKNRRIYLFRFASFLTCLDAKSGKKIWRKTPKNAPELFEALGTYLPRQGWETNWRTRNYLLCSDEALYFAGPQIDKLLAVSTRDGSVLWQNPYNNFQLILRDDGLYGISGQWGSKLSRKFDPLSGEVLAELPVGRRACTRPNAAVDAILFRANDGTVRLDLASLRPQWISPMRPPCHDGVTIANGLLYWWPYVCDCQLSIYGITCLGPAGDFDFNHEATETERLEKNNPVSDNVTSLLETAADWPTFRKDNHGSVTTDAVISDTGFQLWRYPPDNVYQPATNVLGFEHFITPTAPVTVDGIVIYGRSDGIVRALDVTTGKVLWTAYTGGTIRIAPTVWNGRLLVGSGDGWIYNFNARTGELLWRFRAAPIERKIPVYGSLLSTWPAASGVLVDQGTAYVAAGIVNYDGTHVYAIDAETGKIKWQNNTSGHLYAEARTGASVQGHLLLNDGKLYLASGTSLSPAIYDMNDGRCLNDPELLKKCESSSPRGWELYRIGDQVVAGGKPYYSHPRHEVYDETVFNKMLHTSTGKRDIIWVNQKKVLCVPPIDRQLLNDCVIGERYTGFRAPIWGALDNPVWEYYGEGSVALAVGKNAVVVAQKSEIVILDIQNGKILWSQPLEYQPVPWGMAVSRDGKIIVTLEDGSVRCFGGKPTIPIPYVSSNNTYFVDSTRVILTCNIAGAKIHYTTDGSEPTQNSPLYTKPFPLNRAATVKMRAYSQNDVPGFLVSEEFKKVNYAKAKDTGQIEVGLAYDYFEGSFSLVADLDKQKPVKSGIMPFFDLKEREGVSEFGYVYRGYVLVPEDGIYTFYLESNDGSKLYVNEEELIDNDGGHAAIEKSGKIALKAGEYPIMVKYFQMGAAKKLSVCWEGPSFEKQPITAEVLFHKSSK